MNILTVNQGIEAEGAEWQTFACVGDGGMIRGLMNLNNSNKPFPYVSALWVDPACRRKGLARDMLHAAVGYCALRNAMGIQLWVHKDNAPAIALYRSCGFIRCDEEDKSSGKFMMVLPLQR